jgi:hypothetical protein
MIKFGLFDFLDFFSPILEHFGHTSTIEPLIRLSLIANQKVRSHKISQSVVRDKWPFDSMSEINCHKRTSGSRISYMMVVVLKYSKVKPKPEE